MPTSPSLDKADASRVGQPQPLGDDSGDKSAASAKARPKPALPLKLQQIPQREAGGSQGVEYASGSHEPVDAEVLKLYSVSELGNDYVEWRGRQSKALQAKLPALDPRTSTPEDTIRAIDSGLEAVAKELRNLKIENLRTSTEEFQSPVNEADLHRLRADLADCRWVVEAGSSKLEEVRARSGRNKLARQQAMATEDFRNEYLVGRKAQLTERLDGNRTRREALQEEVVALRKDHRDMMAQNKSKIVRNEAQRALVSNRDAEEAEQLAARLGKTTSELEAQLVQLKRALDSGAKIEDPTGSLKRMENQYADEKAAATREFKRAQALAAKNEKGLAELEKKKKGVETGQRLIQAESIVAVYSLAELETEIARFEQEQPDVADAAYTRSFNEGEIERRQGDRLGAMYQHRLITDTEKLKALEAELASLQAAARGESAGQE
jgi:hypothetical protein